MGVVGMIKIADIQYNFDLIFKDIDWVVSGGERKRTVCLGITRSFPSGNLLRYMISICILQGERRIIGSITNLADIGQALDVAGYSTHIYFNPGGRDNTSDTDIQRRFVVGLLYEFQKKHRLFTAQNISDFIEGQTLKLKAYEIAYILKGDK